MEFKLLESKKEKTIEETINNAKKQIEEKKCFLKNFFDFLNSDAQTTSKNK